MKTNDLIKTLKETLIPLAGFILAILNIWLASRLAPISQDVAVLGTRVSANEHVIEGVEDSLVRLENKLDKALEFIYSK